MTGPQRTRNKAAQLVTPQLAASLGAGVTGSGRTACHSPLTGDRLAELPATTTAEVAEAFATARAAAARWAARPVRERAAVVLRFHDLLLDRQDEVLDLLQLDTGKARTHAHDEVLGAALASRYYGRRGPGLLRTRARTGAVPVLTRVRENRQPHGVVGQIVPWNYPLELTVEDALPALLAGNGVVTKPDTEGALAALWARRLMVEAGLPADVWRMVIGDGPVVGPAVVAHADYVAFTGSTATGRRVAAQAAERLVGTSLELGGKNSLLVLDDADVEKAAAGAVRACFSSAGQLCISAERILVHVSVADAFTERFVALTRAMRLGAPLAWGTDMGSLSSQAQLDRVTGHIDDAVSLGARVLTGGRHRPDLGPYFHEPTVLTGVTPGMRLHHEETFGPVVAVRRVEDDEEAVALANDTAYGLNASVWSRDSRRARRIAARLRTGSVGINDGFAAAYGSVAATMGGMGDSGLGRRHGAEGLLKYTEAQTVAQQRLLPLAPSLGMDDRQFAALMSVSLKALKTLRLP
ncbi:succinic semialdehyde dehydrogenase [Streptomyces lonarensis]|uniref:succinate-semialdehyde dehydrogenase (NADP(+)) n=1 Tax=Streptomyces lonarensis TaxID=700599 RepID=A0A7X6D2A5_9ACTN|nr:succinic semialdehyde dehydrogenase [Streptomyces lonarensis]NJQ06799.1 succinate-semialdehyde dehydrogenase (NADP(+)) [Streptomyces lonarensis]